MKAPATLTIPATIDGNIFTHFALFDTFRMKKRWKSPLLFTLIMTFFSLICFAVRKTKEDAALLGFVLLACALVLPAVWFFMFMISIRGQIKKNGLSETKAQYFVMLSDEKIRVVKGKEEIEHTWEDAYMAYRVKDCIYLYVSTARAYLMPESQDAEAAWAMISRCLPKEKMTDYRKNRK